MSSQRCVSLEVIFLICSTHSCTCRPYAGNETLRSAIYGCTSKNLFVLFPCSLVLGMSMSLTVRISSRRLSKVPPVDFFSIAIICGGRLYLIHSCQKSKKVGFKSFG